MRGAAASPSSRPASTFPAGKPQEPVQKLLVRIGGQRGDFLGHGVQILAIPEPCPLLPHEMSCREQREGEARNCRAPLPLHPSPVWP